MSVGPQTDSIITYGVLLVAGLIAGGIAGYVIDDVPDMALPAVGMLVVAVMLYVEHEIQSVPEAPNPRFR